MSVCVSWACVLVMCVDVCSYGHVCWGCVWACVAMGMCVGDVCGRV